MPRTAWTMIAVGVLGPSLVTCNPSTTVDNEAFDADKESEALVLMVEDIVGLVPGEVVDGANRVLAAQFQSATPRRAVPEVVREASGLPVLDSLPSPRTEAYVVLNLFEPRFFGNDSIVLSAEWLVFDGSGDGGSFWGEDWRYVLDCTPTCTQLRRHGPGHMN